MDDPTELVYGIYLSMRWWSDQTSTHAKGWKGPIYLLRSTLTVACSHPPPLFPLLQRSKPPANLSCLQKHFPWSAKHLQIVGLRVLPPYIFVSLHSLMATPTYFVVALFLLEHNSLNTGCNYVETFALSGVSRLWQEIQFMHESDTSQEYNNWWELWVLLALSFLCSSFRDNLSIQVIMFIH